MSTNENNREIVQLEARLAKDRMRYGKLEGWHGKVIKKVNVYAEEMAELNGRIRRDTYRLSIAKRAKTKGDDKRG